MRKEKPGGMIVGLPKRLGWIATAAVTVLALAPAGATSVQAASTARAAASTARTAARAAAPAARERVPSPKVTGPITGGTHGRPFTSSPVPLGPAGYTQKEYFLTGTATGYGQVGTWGTNGRWKAAAVPGETAPYKTRILVRRPVSPARFNGTVVVEWLNVSFNADIDPDYLYESQQLVAAGYAWVGVSAQQLGVQGPLGLTNWDPARYQTLSHPGDTFSYSIFSQAAESLLRPNGPNPLGPLHPRALIADGESQSAGRMVTYANAIQPLDRLFRGFLIHSRGAGGAPISQAPQAAPAMPAVAQTRTDIGVPVLTVETQTDIVVNGGLGYLPATQRDSRWFRLWEVAGTSHVDSNELGLTSSEILRDIPTFPQGACAALPNDGQERYVMDAGLARLNRWVRAGVPAPRAPRIDISNGAYVTDKFGNAIGGVRTPAVDVPTSTLTGTGNTGSSLVCFLLGTTTPFTAAQLAALYPLHSDYTAAVERSAGREVRKGFLLPADALQIDQAAAGSQIGLPAPTG